ncbi:MAG: hypothetical protein WCL30_00940 [Pseudomonadota bacterium]
MNPESDISLKREDFIAKLRQYTPEDRSNIATDLLANRYQITPSQALPEFSSPFATAVAASDLQGENPDIYALIYESTMPIRRKNIKILKEFRNPGMVSLLADGKVKISTLSQTRYVVIIEKPGGQPLSSLFGENKSPLSETILINYVLRPLTEIIKEFSLLGISHNRINFDNVYLSQNKITLGECISQPAGFSQDYVFEPIERIITSPAAKPDFSPADDCYALAMLALHLALGFKPFSKIEKEDFIELMLAKGSYHTLVVEWELSTNLQDLFRGLLNDYRRERWNIESLDAWLVGRKFNLIQPSLMQEANRPFDCFEKQYFNRKAVAHAIFCNPDEAYTVLLDNKLGKWVEGNVHKPEIAELILRFAGSASADNKRFEKQNSELLAKTLIALDPTSAIRFKSLSLSLDGLAPALLYAFAGDNSEDTQTIIQIIEGDFANFSLEQQKITQDYSTFLSKLQKIKTFLRMKDLGFGLERCIYEFFPELPCQSNLIKQFYADDLKSLLVALDTIAAEQAGNDEFIDRHIAAFITAKLNINKEIQVTELDSIAELSNNKKLVALKLLVKAQSKAGNIKLPGLCFWIAISLFPIFEKLHKRKQRKILQQKLIDAASGGDIRDIVDIFLNPDIFVGDYREFRYYSYEYQKRKKNISDLKNNVILERHARMAGRGISQTFAYGICLTTIYYSCKAYFNF